MMASVLLEGCGVCGAGGCGGLVLAEAVAGQEATGRPGIVETIGIQHYAAIGNDDAGPAGQCLPVEG